MPYTHSAEAEAEAWVEKALRVASPSPPLSHHLLTAILGVMLHLQMR